VDHEAYLAGIAELYAAEVLGEGLASRWLELNSNPDQKYKLALFLQLESEAKVRLRPLLARHGLDLAEDQRQRSAGAAAAAARPRRKGSGLCKFYHAHSPINCAVAASTANGKHQRPMAGFVQ
jgi:hypothetical protein